MSVVDPLQFRSRHEYQARRFVLAVSQLTNLSRAEIDQRFAQLLGAGTESVETVPWRSHLNNDGSPLQICCVSSRTRSNLRLLVDPGVTRSEWSTTPMLARDILGRPPANLSNPQVMGLLQVTILENLPKQEPQFAELSRGSLWLATDADFQSLAVYVNARWGEPQERWTRTANWLGLVLRDPENALEVIKALVSYSRIASVGIEGVVASPQHWRAKVYFRLSKSARLSELNIPLLASERFNSFFLALDGLEFIPATGLVFSISFAIGTGRLSDAKIDVCGHCLRWNSSQWQAFEGRFQQQFGFGPTTTMGDVLTEGLCDLAFLGLGLDTDQQPRLNVYLKPCETKE